MSLITPQHIVKGDQLYVFDAIDNDHVWYVQAFCGTAPSCDRVQTILPQGVVTAVEYPETNWTPTPAESPVPEPAMWLVVGLALLAAVIRRRMAV
jgi:MYXO-CTERM domain-containing protein